MLLCLLLLLLLLCYLLLLLLHGQLLLLLFSHYLLLLLILSLRQLLLCLNLSSLSCLLLSSFLTNSLFLHFLEKNRRSTQKRWFNRHGSRCRTHSSLKEILLTSSIHHPHVLTHLLWRRRRHLHRLGHRLHSLRLHLGGLLKLCRLLDSLLYHARSHRRNVHHVHRMHSLSLPPLQCFLCLHRHRLLVELMNLRSHSQPLIDFVLPYRLLLQVGAKSGTLPLQPQHPLTQRIVVRRIHHPRGQLGILLAQLVVQLLGLLVADLSELHLVKDQLLLLVQIVHLPLQLSVGAVEHGNLRQLDGMAVIDFWSHPHQLTDGGRYVSRPLPCPPPHELPQHLVLLLQPFVTLHIQKVAALLAHLQTLRPHYLQLLAQQPDLIVLAFVLLESARPRFQLKVVIRLHVVLFDLLLQPVVLKLQSLHLWVGAAQLHQVVLHISATVQPCRQDLVFVDLPVDGLAEAGRRYSQPFQPLYAVLVANWVCGFQPFPQRLCRLHTHQKFKLRIQSKLLGLGEALIALTDLFPLLIAKNYLVVELFLHIPRAQQLLFVQVVVVLLAGHELGDLLLGVVFLVQFELSGRHLFVGMGGRRIIPFRRHQVHFVCYQRHQRRPQHHYDDGEYHRRTMVLEQQQQFLQLSPSTAHLN